MKKEVIQVTHKFPVTLSPGKELQLARRRIREIFLRMKHEHLKLKALSNPDVKAEYDALEPEFALLREMLSAREKPA